MRFPIERFIEIVESFYHDTIKLMEISGSVPPPELIETFKEGYFIGATDAIMKIGIMLSADKEMSILMEKKINEESKLESFIKAQ